MTTTLEPSHSQADRAEGAWAIKGRSAMLPAVRSQEEAVALRAARPYDPADLSSLDFWRRPAEQREHTYAELRRRAAVSWHQPVEEPLVEDANDQGFWAVTSYELLVEATKRHQDFISGEGIVFESIPQELLDAGQGFIAMDPPRHTQVRRLLASAFTPKQIARIDGRIRANATRVVDELLEHGGSADYVPTVAGPTPMHNIFDMLGLPEDRRLEAAHEAQFASMWRDPEVMGDDVPLVRIGMAAWTLREQAGAMIEDRRDNPTDDLLTALVQAEIDGERLTTDEIVSFYGLLCVAGTDTTRQSISHAMVEMTRNPDQKAWLLGDLEGRVSTAVEEMVRWATPIMTFRRTCSRDTTLGGVEMTQGDKVILFYSSANRDESVFEAPNTFDLSRSPNPHVSFGGGGIHTCLGNMLARKQIAALHVELLRRVPDIRASGDPVYTLSNFFHGVSHLPVEWSA